MKTLIAASVAWMAVAQQPARTPGLSAEHLYNGVGRPVMIQVTSPRAFGKASLVLMAADGGALVPAVEVHPGRVDLAEMMPAVWSLERAAFLQMIDLDQPVGGALVVQPLLSRKVPQTEQALRPTGATYTKIVGWHDENAPPPPPLEVPTATAPDQDQQSVEPPTELPQIERLCSGLRIYPETDVMLHTSSGNIRVALRPDEAPNTAWNFLELCRGGFYRGVVFHRVVPRTPNGLPFVIQAGDPTGTGDGGPGYWLPIEDSQLPHDFGVISMARSDDPDSNGSQFFFCLSREGTARLDGQYCSFGYAVDGAEVIKAISEVELADIAAGKPVQPPVITDAELVPAPPRMPGSGGGRPDSPVTMEDAKKAEPKPTGRVPR